MYISITIIIIIIIIIIVCIAIIIISYYYNLYYYSLLGNRLYAANVGDSRTLLCRNMQAYPLSIDHKPSREDEAIRIREAGGFIINNRLVNLYTFQMRSNHS